MATIHEVYPYLRVNGAAQAIDFYRRAFRAEELFRLTEPGGRIGHAEIKFGPATIMLSEESPASGVRGPLALGGTSIAIHLHVDDVDAAFARAVAAGAEIIRPLQNQFYGECSGMLRDPFGHEWLLGAQIESVTPEDMQHRYTALFNKPTP